MGFFKDLFFGTISKPIDIPPQSPSPFEIVNGELKKYKGFDTHVVVPQGVKKIGIYAFFNAGIHENSHINIEEVILPNGVIEIDDSAFFNCKNLHSITIPNTVKKISMNAFSGCMSLTDIRIPESVEEIGDNVFSRTGIISFKLPENLKNTAIPSGLFRACPNLTNVTIPPIFNSIGVAAFSECSKLKKIIIPEGVTRISGSAFSDCESLCEVQLPNSLIEIKESAFENSHPTIYVHPESKVMDVMKRRGWNVSVIMDLKTKLFSLNGTYCINHKMGKGDWPLLASNGTMDLFTQQELAEAYISKIKRNIEVCFIPKPFLDAYLESWYAKGIRKIKMDDHNYEILNISDLLDNSAFPDTLHPTLEFARTMVTYKQCEEDNEGFIAGIIGGSVQNMLPKTVFLTLLRAEAHKTEGIPCSSLAKEIMEGAGISTFPGLESYIIAEPTVKHEDMQSFQCEGKQVAYLFTDINELKSVVSEDSNFGIVAYGDVAYRIMNPESCGELNAGIINPGGFKCWIR